MGYFIGKLGCARVCVLYEEVEISSDIHGVVYVPYVVGNSWRLNLVGEIRTAQEISADLNRT